MHTYIQRPIQHTVRSQHDRTRPHTCTDEATQTRQQTYAVPHHCKVKQFFPSSSVRDTNEASTRSSAAGHHLQEPASWCACGNTVTCRRRVCMHMKDGKQGPLWTLAVNLKGYPEKEHKRFLPIPETNAGCPGLAWSPTRQYSWTQPQKSP